MRSTFSSEVGGAMFSLRSAVIALVASAALVLVLAGVSAGVFSTQPSPPPVGQSVSVHQDGAVPARTAPVPPNIAAPPPAAPAPQPAAPVPAPAAPAPAAPARHDLAVPAPAPMPSQPVTHYRQVQQPAPAVTPPVSVAPAQAARPASPPPSAALPAREAKSRTVNTEPCACDGRMRQVSTHWDPPQG